MQRITHMLQLTHSCSRTLPRWMPFMKIGVRHYEAGDFLKTKSNHYSGTMTEVANKIRKRVDIDIGYHVVPKSREHLLEYTPKPDQLPERSMQDSYTSAILPLENDEMSRERYTNHVGAVRMGRLMEELDMFAVWLCHRHIKIPDLPKDVALPYTFVTLLVDRVEFSNIEKVVINKDIELSGFVSWTGSTSLEATLYVRQLVDGKYLNVTKALFLMVCRNATNTGSAPVNKLKPANEMEDSFLKKALERQEKRKVERSTLVTIIPPQEHEQAIMYGLLQRSTPPNNFDLNKRVLPAKCRWMKSSQRSTMMNPFPENRNSQNTIFGGYLMRQAVEISFIMASIYIGGRPLLTCISDISFMEPVSVRSFLQMTAYVVFTAQNYVQIMTVARRWDVQANEQITTNVFNLTYKAESVVDEVMPGSYKEMLWYIHGRRKFLAALKLQPDYEAALKLEESINEQQLKLDKKKLDNQ